MSPIDDGADDLREFLKERRLSATGLTGRAWGSAEHKEEDYTVNHWKWADLHAALLKAGEVIDLGPGSMVEMRVVSGSGGARAPISLGTQILLRGSEPGRTAT